MKVKGKSLSNSVTEPSRVISKPILSKWSICLEELQSKHQLGFCLQFSIFNYALLVEISYLMCILMTEVDIHFTRIWYFCGLASGYSVRK